MTETEPVSLLDSGEDYDMYGNLIVQPPTINREALANALAKTFVGMSLEEVVGIITNRYDELIEYMALTQGKRSCQKTSLLFNPQRLDTPGSTDKRYGSVYKALQNPDFHKGLARATIFRGNEMGSFKSNDNEKPRVGEVFYFALQIGINGTQYINEFPPHLARDMAYKYVLNKESKILDPCAGWGGRMLGFSVVSNNYTCYDPSTATANGLKQLSEFINSINPHFSADVVCEPYEDTDETENYYDFAMTSPPYYDTEHYSEEPNNSFNRYKTFEEWCEHFYLVLVDKTMRQLKSGQPFIVNIGDRKYPLTKVLQTHCESKNYTMRRIKGGIINNSGFGREADGGEKFWELTTGEKIEGLF